MNISSSARPASKTPFTASRFEKADLDQTEPQSMNPQDEMTFSSRDDAGWKIAGMSIALFSVPLAIAAKSVPMAVIGAGVGLAIAFGSDA